MITVLSWLGVCAFRQVGLLKPRRDQVRKKCENERRRHEKKEQVEGVLFRNVETA